jgi:hypothetical protein
MVAEYIGRNHRVECQKGVRLVSWDTGKDLEGDVEVMGIR